MAIVLNPEQERRVNEALRDGGYSNAEDSEAEWFSENREQIGAAIEEGFAEAERGELIDGDEVRVRMAARKELWRKEHSECNVREL